MKIPREAKVVIGKVKDENRVSVSVWGVIGIGKDFEAALQDLHTELEIRRRNYQSSANKYADILERMAS